MFCYAKLTGIAVRKKVIACRVSHLFLDSASWVVYICRILAVKLSDNSAIRAARTEAVGAKFDPIKQPQDLNQSVISNA